MDFEPKPSTSRDINGSDVDGDLADSEGGHGDVGEESDDDFEYEMGEPCPTQFMSSLKKAVPHFGCADDIFFE